MYKNSSISIYQPITNEDIDVKIASLTQRFGFSTTSDQPIANPYLNYTENGLGLYSCAEQRSKSIETLLHIDFVGGKNGYRYAKDCTIKQAIARAVGIKSGFRPTVFDATAGLGGDAFVLACLGATVFLCERSPLLFCLLKDALKRAQSSESIQDITEKRMHLMHGNSSEILQNTNDSYHTVYMDPMYPHKKKAALNKKEMRVIRSFVGDDQDSEVLLTTALDKAKNRVVVKRPKGAPYVMAKKPSHEILMKNSRFDVYLTNTKH